MKTDSVMSGIKSDGDEKVFELVLGSKRVQDVYRGSYLG